MNVMTLLIYALTMQLVSTHLVLIYANVLTDLPEMDSIVQVLTIILYVWCFLQAISIDVVSTDQYVCFIGLLFSASIFSI